MKYIVPEYDFIRFIYHLSIKSKSILKQDFYENKVYYPENICYSKKFIDAYEKIVKKIIIKALIEEFNTDTFPVVENDTVQYVSVLHENFWKNRNFKFTDKALNVLWNYFMKRSLITKFQPDINATSEDLLLLTLLKVPLNYFNELKDFYHHISLKRENDWSISVYFLRKFMELKVLPSENPLMSFLDNAKYFSLPLRYYLIKAYSFYFSYYSQMLQGYFELYSSESQKLKLNISGKNITIEKDIATLKHWAKIDNTGIKPLRISINYWTNEGMLGYDDDACLTEIIRITDINKQMDSLETLSENINEIIQMQER